MKHLNVSSGEAVTLTVDEPVVLIGDAPER